MPHLPHAIFLAGLLSFHLACNVGPEGIQGEPLPSASMTHVPSGSAPSNAGASFQGKVAETMNSGGYTYVLIDDGQKQTWVAGPEMKVAVGDPVTAPPGGAMPGFVSNTLNRKFDMIYFVPNIRVTSGPNAGAPSEPQAYGSPSASPKAAPSVTSFAGIKKPSGGYTVAEFFEKAASLAGKDVALRGKVTKTNNGIMGKNWIHVQDGTGGEGTNDVTVTSTQTAEVGSTVLVKGKAAINKDFGYSYKYPAMLEDASVTVE